MFKVSMAVKRKPVRQAKLSGFPTNVNYQSSLRWLVSGLVLIGLIFLVIKLVSAWSQLWPVKQIVIEGEPRYLQREVIVEFVKQQSIPGMLAIDLNQLQKAAKKIDWVKAVEIKKIWPDKLVFNIQEHHPVVFLGDSILTQQGSRISVDESNQEFNQLPLFDFKSKVQMTDAKYLTLWNSFKQIKREFELLSLTPEKLLVDELSNWVLYFSNGLEINLGRKNHHERIDRLVNSYTKIKNKNQLKKIDLRYHNGLAIQWLDNPREDLTANLFARKES